MTWLDSRKLALDTESTGLDPLTDRVVTVSLWDSPRPGAGTPRTWLVDPGIEIPEAATKVHGITTERARAEGGSPRAALLAVWDALYEAADNGYPVVGHGLRFDLTLLAAEFARHDVPPLPSNLLVLDTLVLFRRLDWSTGGRTLAKLAARHGITFPAHDAEADALASLRLLHIIAGENELLPHVALPVLHRMQAHWYDAQQEQARAKALGNGTPFTPAPGWPLAEVAW